MSTYGADIFPELARYIEGMVEDPGYVPRDRRASLDLLSDFIADQLRQDRGALLLFICTHNSRRSLIAQVWATVAAAWHELPDVYSFSGGTEVTAFNQRAVSALERSGFKIHRTAFDTDGREEENPRYSVSFSNTAPDIECYSKLFTDPVNPKTKFAAVMTCDEADQQCPFIPKAVRIALSYDDPKSADGTPFETARYDERVRQVGRELFYAMARVRRLVRAD